jgi:outer membrane protein OmpA-like peptidoglycan-associated protein
MNRQLTSAIGVGLLSLAAHGQAQRPTGDGVEAVYYAGSNFERPLLRRREPTVYEHWSRLGPAPGIPAENFSVRWTGWLVPPVSGRYLLHVSVDDGMRIWLNDRLLVNAWQIQPASRFSVSVQLQAGQAYKLRVDYFQGPEYTRARLTWQLPPVPASWRNVWGLRTMVPAPEPIAQGYLFSRQPALPTLARLPPSVPEPSPPRSAPKRIVPSPLRPLARVRQPPAKTRLPPPLPPARPQFSHDSSASRLLDSALTRSAPQLQPGHAMVLPALRFEQGRAVLLPTAQVALDSLAALLQIQPAWQLEVQGHTDNQGDKALNRQLSQRRAEIVCLYLTAHGIAARRLRPVGYGGTHPIADNRDPSRRPLNRRVVFVCHPRRE